MWIGVWVIRRLQDDMKFSAGGESFKMRYVWQSLTDWKTWVASKCFNVLLLHSTSSLITLLSVAMYMGLYVGFLEPFTKKPLSHPYRYSDGPLFAFSLFTPTIINQVSNPNLSKRPLLLTDVFHVLPTAGYASSSSLDAHNAQS